MTGKRLATIAIVALFVGGAELLATGTGVVINREELRASELAQASALLGATVPPGRYWYDRFSGAWGVEGGPAAGFTRAGLPYGGELQPDASTGGTAVFVNGRELHPLDVVALRRCTPVYAGRYWINQHGVGGYEGGPAFFNLAQLCAPRRGSGRSGLFSYGSVVAGDGILGFVDGEGRSFHVGN